MGGERERLEAAAGVLERAAEQLGELGAEAERDGSVYGPTLSGHAEACAAAADAFRASVWVMGLRAG